jgi:spermidine synthase
MEKFQYGQTVTFQVEKVLEDFTTEKGRIMYVRTTCHGDILLMGNSDDFEVQFSTLDEHRYHHILVPENICYGKNVLILGGGDGLALRDVYKSRFGNNVERAILVDYDQEFVERFGQNYERNNESLKDPRTTVVYMDAFDFVNKCSEKFDTVIVDLPDPDSIAMQELYFNILGSISKVMKETSGFMCHVGPVSLCEKHPNWTFITKFANRIKEIFNLTPQLSTAYIPSYSHEWGVIHFTELPSMGDSECIDIYRRLV